MVFQAFLCIHCFYYHSNLQMSYRSALFLCFLLMIHVCSSTDLQEGKTLCS